MSMINGLPEYRVGAVYGRDALLNNLASSENAVSGRDIAAEASTVNVEVTDRQQRLELGTSQEKISIAAYIAVANTVELMPNQDDYWEEAPELPPQDNTSWRELHGLATRRAVAKPVEPATSDYMSQAPQLPIQNKS